MFLFIFFRFGSQHLTPSGRNIINISLHEKFRETKSTFNQLDKSVQFSLRKRHYDFSKSDSVIAKYDRKSKEKVQYRHSKKDFLQNESKGKEQLTKEVSGENNTLRDVNDRADVDFICKVDSENDNGSENCADGDSVTSVGEIKRSGAITDEDVIKVRTEERKRVMESVI